MSFPESCDCLLLSYVTAYFAMFNHCCFFFFLHCTVFMHVIHVVLLFTAGCITDYPLGDIKDNLLYFTTPEWSIKCYLCFLYFSVDNSWTAESCTKFKDSIRQHFS